MTFQESPLNSSTFNPVDAIWRTKTHQRDTLSLKGKAHEFFRDQDDWQGSFMGQEQNPGITEKSSSQKKVVIINCRHLVGKPSHNTKVCTRLHFL